jgi:prepilin-type N-terminal cleavage/methylation domain-containing protein
MRKRLNNEAGFSLVEMMVVVLVLGAVLAGMYQALSNIQSSSSGAAERVINLDEGRVLMDTLTKDFRTATRLTPTSYPIVSGTWQSATFYARLNTTGQPVRVDISLDAEGRLEEKITDPVCSVGTTPCPDNMWTYPGPAKTRIVGRWVDKTVPVFTYYSVTTQGVLTPITLGPPQDASLTDTQRANVRAIGISLKIRRSPNLGATPTVLTSRVRLPNIQ